MVFRKFAHFSDNSEANLSFSSSPPKKAKFSGNPINSAPLLAANSICSSASTKFASTFEVLVICNAATKKSVKTLLLVNQSVNHEARITPLSTCAGTISKQSSSEQHLKSSS